MRASSPLLLLGSLLLAGSGLMAPGAADEASPAVDLACSGVLMAGPETRVALAKKGTAPAQWIKVGETFSGYTVKAFDPAQGMVVLAKDGREFRLPLNEGKVVAGAVEPPAEIKNKILGNLRQLAAAADQYYLEHGKSTVAYDELVGPTRYIKKLEPIDGENYRQLTFALGQKLSLTTPGGFTISFQP